MSGTPRTDAVALDITCGEYEILDHARQLERELAELQNTAITLSQQRDLATTQRDAANKTLSEIRQLFVDDESFGATVEALFAKPLEEAEAEIARLNSLLNANVDAPAP